MYLNHNFIFFPIYEAFLSSTITFNFSTCFFFYIFLLDQHILFYIFFFIIMYIYIQTLCLPLLLIINNAMVQ